MNSIHNVVFLIKGHIDGTLDDARKGELQRWLAASETNRMVFERILSNKNLKQRLDFRETFDNESNWEQIIAEIERWRHPKTKSILRRTHIARYAAAAAFIIVSLFAIDHIRKGAEAGDPQVMVEQLVATDENDIYLELLDGTTVTLGDRNSGFKTMNVEGAILHEEDNALVVSSGENEETAGTVGRIVVPRGRTYKVVLSDGTKVWINSDSKFEFPNIFTGDTRNVNLQGEAYFEVAENKDKPFIVRAGNMDVRVLGTSFNVSSYDESVVTTLVSGRVSLDTPVGNYDLRPGHQGTFAGNGMNIKAIDSSKYTAWVRGLFVFDNESLEQMMGTVSRWYDAKIVFTDEALKTLHFTCCVQKNEPFDHLQRILEGTGLVKFSVTDSVVTISAK